MAKGRRKKVEKAKAKEEKFPTNKKPATQANIADKSESLEKQATAPAATTGIEIDAFNGNPLDESSNLPVHGLTNLGNTCFFNSTVQCLVSTRPLLSLIPKLSSLPIPLPLHSKVASFLTDYLSPQKKNGVTISPSNLFSEIAKGNSVFRGSKQQDAHELLRYLISTLVAEGEEREVAERKKAAVATLANWDSAAVKEWCESHSLAASIYPTLQSIASSDQKDLNGRYLYSLVEMDTKEIKRKRARLAAGLDEKGKKSLIQALTNVKRGILLPISTFSPSFPANGKNQLIQSLFSGVLENTVECLTCHNISETKEIFYDLSLSIEPPRAPSPYTPIKNAWIQGKGKGKGKKIDEEKQKEIDHPKKGNEKDEIPEVNEILTFPTSGQKKKKQTPSNFQKPHISKKQKKAEKLKAKKKKSGDSKEPQADIETSALETTDISIESETNSSQTELEGDLVNEEKTEEQIARKQSIIVERNEKEGNEHTVETQPAEEIQKGLEPNSRESTSDVPKERPLNAAEDQKVVALAEDISKLQLEEVNKDNSADDDKLEERANEENGPNDTQEKDNPISTSEEQEEKQMEEETKEENSTFLDPLVPKPSSPLPSIVLSQSRPVTPPSPDLLARYSSLGAARLKGECSVMDCLSAYFDYELLSGSESYACEKCGEREQQLHKSDSEERKEPFGDGDTQNNENESHTSTDEMTVSNSPIPSRYTVKRNAQKRLIISTSPTILTLHLKRFSANLSGRLLEKINKAVTIDWILDLQQFIKVNDTNDTNSNYEYELYGVVCHSGGMSGGHYISYSKRGANLWVMCSDTHTKVATVSDVSSCQPYILFYQRKQSQERSRKKSEEQEEMKEEISTVT